MKLDIQAMRSYFSLIVNMSFISCQIKKLVPQRIMLKTTARSDRPWSANFCVIVYTLVEEFRHKTSQLSIIYNCLIDLDSIDNKVSFDYSLIYVSHAVFSQMINHFLSTNLHKMTIFKRSVT